MPDLNGARGFDEQASDLILGRPPMLRVGQGPGQPGFKANPILPKTVRQECPQFIQFSTAHRQNPKEISLPDRRPESTGRG
jgi:hypothetical protein